MLSQELASLSLRASGFYRNEKSRPQPQTFGGPTSACWYRERVGFWRKADASEVRFAQSGHEDEGSHFKCWPALICIESASLMRFRA